MNVGLPGTGIGGLFYLLSAFLILLYELLMTMRGKSNMKRWKIVGEQIGITITMVAAAILMNAVLSKYFAKQPPVQATSDSVMSAILATYSQHPLLVPVTLLAIVLAVTQILQVVLRASAAKT